MTTTDPRTETAESADPGLSSNGAETNGARHEEQEEGLTLGHLLEPDHIDVLTDALADKPEGAPLGPRKIFSLLTKADRQLSDFSAFEAMTTKKAPWPMLERPYRGSVSLPPPAEEISLPLSQALADRRSKHHAAAEPLPATSLSSVLHWSAGVREQIPAYNRQQYPMRYAPSAGGLAPIDIYLVANNVEDVAQGLYYYHPGDHALRLLDDGNLRRVLARSAIYAEWLGYASVVMILVGDLDRVEWKYGERGYRFLHVDSGVLCQNLYLTGTAVGLNTCAVAAYYDEEMSRLLGIDGDRQFPVVLFALSVPPETSILSEPLRTANGQ